MVDIYVFCRILCASVWWYRIFSWFNPNMKNVASLLTLALLNPDPSRSTLTHWGLVSTKIWVNFGSGNGLLPDGTKPLPEPMLTYHQVRFSDVYLTAVSQQEMPQASFTEMNLKITFTKFHSNLPGAKVYAPLPLFWETSVATILPGSEGSVKEVIEIHRHGNGYIVSYMYIPYIQMFHISLLVSQTGPSCPKVAFSIWLVSSTGAVFITSPQKKTKKTTVFIPVYSGLHQCKISLANFLSNIKCSRVLASYTRRHTLCVWKHQWLYQSLIIKSAQYTGGDFMFLYRFVRRRRRLRRRRRPQILVHAITFEQLFGFLSFLAQLLALTYRLPD